MRVTEIDGRSGWPALEVNLVKYRAGPVELKKICSVYRHMTGCIPICSISSNMVQKAQVGCCVYRPTLLCRPAWLSATRLDTVRIREVSRYLSVYIGDKNWTGNITSPKLMFGHFCNTVRISAARGRAGIPASVICIFWSFLKINSILCCGVTAINDSYKRLWQSRERCRTFWYLLELSQTILRTDGQTHRSKHNALENITHPPGQVIKGLLKS